MHPCESGWALPDGLQHHDKGPNPCDDCNNGARIGFRTAIAASGRPDPESKPEPTT